MKECRSAGGREGGRSEGGRERSKVGRGRKHVRERRREE